MGCCFSKTPPRRSSRNSEKNQSHYAPSAPSWDIIDSSSGYTLETRNEELSSCARCQISDVDRIRRIKAAYRKRSDCVYYYHGECTKGDSCIYRHEPAALGSKIMCVRWKHQKCFVKHCQLRHMILENNKHHCPVEKKHVSCHLKECPFKHSKSEDKQEDKKENNENIPKVHTHRRCESLGRASRRGCRPQFDKEKQSTNSAAAVQGLSSELLQQINLEVKEVQKKPEGERASAMEKFKKDHEKLASIMPEDKTKEIITKMERALNCCICFELFVSPVTLNCSHTFCQFCIKEWRKDNMNCPLCRNNITSEARALNIDNLIVEMIPDFPEEMKQKRENVIRQREILSSFPY